MSRLLRTAIAVSTLSLTSCARTPSLPRATLAVADPSGAESAFTPPPNVFASEPPRSHRQALPTRGATDHSGHGVAPTPPPFADPEPTPAKATATPAGTPRPAKAPAEYVCPMHPDVRDTKASECPKCGMTLELVVPKATPTATPAPRASPKASPTPAPGGHEHHQRSRS